MPSSTSYQLPDLVCFTHPFELRTNRYCRAVTVASENRILSNDANVKVTLDETERAALHGVKAGLLAALCYPTADAPQLRLATDFLSSLLCSNSRVLRSPRRDSGWTGDEPSFGPTRQENTPSVFIADHALFQHLSPNILRLAGRVHPSWLSRFNRSTLAFRAAEIQLVANRSQDIVPDLESYIELRRDLSGLGMLFDLIELVEGLNLPDEVMNDPILRKLAKCAADIIAWSMDIVSYNLDQSHGNKHNLISILMLEKGLSIQGAIHFAASLVKQTIKAFTETEHALSNKSTPPSTNVLARVSACPYSWSMGSSPRYWDKSGQANRDVVLYVQGLRDFIVGSVNWMYETQLFFGNKGEEVRAFGWVFLMSRKENKEPVMNLLHNFA